MFTKNQPAQDILVLLEYLQGQDDGLYSYRGQLRDYGSILPSLYRSVTETSYLRGNYRRISKQRLITNRTQRDIQRERAMYSLVRAVGYGLGNILAQQYGLRSETVDITDDPRIAAFFATHQFPSYKTVHASDQEIGVIYRFRDPHQGRVLPVEELRFNEELSQVRDMPGQLWVERPQRLVWLSAPEQMRIRQEEQYHLTVPNLFCSGHDTQRILAELQKDAQVANSLGKYSPNKRFLDYQNSRWARQMGGYIRPAIAYEGYIEGSFEISDNAVGMSVLKDATAYLDAPIGIVDLAQLRHTETFYFRHSGKQVDIEREYLWPHIFEDVLFASIAKLIAIDAVDYFLEVDASSVWDQHVGLLDRGYYDDYTDQQRRADWEDMRKLMSDLSAKFKERTNPG